MPKYQPLAINLAKLDRTVRAYLECAEWCGIDDEQREAFEGSVSTWSDESIRRATDDCAAFRDLVGADANDIDDRQLGHDFWLTRNGHGAGFWDRGLGDVGERLTAAARSYGDAYVEFDEKTSTLHLS